MRYLSLMALAAVLACSQAAPGEAIPQDTPAVLKVDNMRPVDMTIYVIESGNVRERLGLARAAMVTSFTVPERLSRRNATLRFLADPIGGRALPVSQDINIGPGDEVLMRITP
jgi:hypothetical protein